MTNRWISAGLWGAAVLVAVGAGAAAVSAASASGGRDVLSQQDVARELRAVPGTPTGSASTGTGTNGSDATGHLVATHAGTLAVNCAAGQATLLRWTPNPGYRADDPVVGPAAVVSVKFESDTASDVVASVRCVAGMPVPSTTAALDDHGGAGNSGTPSPSPSNDHGGSRGPGGIDDSPSHH
jgi:hypothetical protein